jgi:hypothetical protein
VHEGVAVRSLVVVLAVSLVAWLAAAASIVYSFQQTNQERRALVAFVCAAILIQEEAGTPLADEYADHFGAILADLGETCPTTEGERP